MDKLSRWRDVRACVRRGLISASVAALIVTTTGLVEGASARAAASPGAVSGWGDPVVEDFDGTSLDPDR